MNLDGFFGDDDQENLVPQRSLPSSFVSARDSSGNEQEEIEAYLESLKTRAALRDQESGNIGSSSTQDSRSELWTIPVPVRSFFTLYRLDN